MRLAPQLGQQLGMAPDDGRDLAQVGQGGDRLAGEGRRATASGRLWTLPVCFDDDLAPDLADVAAILKACPGKVVSIQDATLGGTPLSLLTFCEIGRAHV